MNSRQLGTVWILLLTISLAGCFSSQDSLLPPSATSSYVFKYEYWRRCQGGTPDCKIVRLRALKNGEFTSLEAGTDVDYRITTRLLNDKLFVIQYGNAAGYSFFLGRAESADEILIFEPSCDMRADTLQALAAKGIVIDGAGKDHDECTPKIAGNASEASVIASFKVLANDQRWTSATPAYSAYGLAPAEGSAAFLKQVAEEKQKNEAEQ
jgi:hypothetical protein